MYIDLCRKHTHIIITYKPQYHKSQAFPQPGGYVEEPSTELACLLHFFQSDFAQVST